MANKRPLTKETIERLTGLINDKDLRIERKRVTFRGDEYLLLMPRGEMLDAVLVTENNYKHAGPAVGTIEGNEILHFGEVVGYVEELQITGDATDVEIEDLSMLKDTFKDGEDWLKRATSEPPSTGEKEWKN